LKSPPPKAPEWRENHPTHRDWVNSQAETVIAIC